jgi:hypothetical protein
MGRAGELGFCFSKSRPVALSLNPKATAKSAGPAEWQLEPEAAGPSGDGQCKPLASRSRASTRKRLAGHRSNRNYY